MWLRALVLISTILFSISTISGESARKPEVVFPRDAPDIDKLRRVSELCVLKKELPESRYNLSGNVCRYGFNSYALKSAKFSDDTQSGKRQESAAREVQGERPRRNKDNNSKEVWLPDKTYYGPLLAVYAEAYSMFPPEGICKSTDIISNNIRPSKNLSFLTVLLDSYCRSLGWNKVLQSNLTEEQKNILKKLSRMKVKGRSLEEQKQKLNKLLEKQLPTVALEKAITFIILHKHFHSQDKSLQKNSLNTSLTLADKPKYKMHVLRWCTLSGENIPQEALAELGGYVFDRDCDFSIRSLAMRLYAVKGGKKSFFDKLRQQLRDEMPTYARRSAKESFWHTYEWSEAVFTIRQEGFEQLLEETLADKASTQLEQLGAFFYPRKYFLAVLTDLEQHKGKITKGSIYQGVLKKTAREMCERGIFSEDLDKRLEHDLLTLEGYVRKVILLSAIEGTQNFERFALPIIKCYKANKDSYSIESANVAKSCIWRLDRLGRKANIDCVQYLERNKKSHPYKKYHKTIENIIMRVPEIRQYRKNVQQRAMQLRN